MNRVVQNRYEFVYLFDVKNGNPNGDPDAGNLPRIDPETSHGIVTDVCLKRKIRNYVDIAKQNKPPFEIHVREGAFLSEHHKRAHLAIENEAISIVVPEDLKNEFESFEGYPVGISFSKEGNPPFLTLSLSDLEDAEKEAKKIKEKKKQEDLNNKQKLSMAAKASLMELFVDCKEKRAAQWMCKNFFDVRTFGAVMSTGDKRCGQVRGPVQLGFARSIDPIFGLDISMFRTAAVKIEEPDDRGLGARKSVVPYGLYRAHGFISAPLAKQTGFSEEDLELLWKALQNMFDHDHSAARGEMTSRGLIVFKHNSELGNASAQGLFDLVTVERSKDPSKTDVSKPARSFYDYDVVIAKDKLPDGVTIEEKI
jgi:CRISPR-associated protein Csd2